MTSSAHVRPPAVKPGPATRPRDQVPEAVLTTPAAASPRYEAHETPPLATSVGHGVLFSFIASATLLVTPVIVANASGRGDSYIV